MRGKGKKLKSKGVIIKLVVGKKLNLLESSLIDLYTLNPSQIVMYTTEYCSDCHRAKSFFDANNIEYRKVGLEDNEEATRFVIQINNGNRTVPTIIFPDGTILVEPSWEELRRKTAAH